MSKKSVVCAAGVFACGLASHGASRNDYKVEAREPVHHVFSAGDSALDVDEVNGSIAIVADNGNTIRVDGEKIIRGVDASEVDRGKREVVLDVNEKDGTAQLYVNGPFRDNGHASESHGFHDHSDRQYEVTYNFTIHVPRAIGVRLRTINGEVKAEQTTGKFDIHTINGNISMTDIAGSGKADTLNGGTTVTFRENPKADSYFKSFNGKVDVTFQPSLSAELRLKTFNGHAYTDFDVTALASAPGTAERKDGRFVYRSNEFHSLRAGSGGPELKFETFNGDIHIKKQAR